MYIYKARLLKRKRKLKKKIKRKRKNILFLLKRKKDYIIFRYNFFIYKIKYIINDYIEYKKFKFRKNIISKYYIPFLD
jgi:hypothetical protein